MSDPSAVRPGGRTRGWDRPRHAPGAVGIVRQTDHPGWRGSVGLDTQHNTLVIVDVEGFGRRSRTNPNKVRIRRGMYHAVQQAFAAAGVDWGACRYSDLGDGVLVLAPARIPKTLLIDLLPGSLADELVAHNAAHQPEERIRLRLALHAGEVSYDDHGVSGSSILHAQGLLDAPELKHALAEAPAVLAVIASDWLFDEVIRHSERGGADAYQPVETDGGTAWIRLLAHGRKPFRGPETFRKLLPHR